MVTVPLLAMLREPVIFNGVTKPALLRNKVLWAALSPVPGADMNTLLTVIVTGWATVVLSTVTVRDSNLDNPAPLVIKMAD